MADYVIDASTFGSYNQATGGSGSDDTVTVNIGEGFSGTINVTSAPADGEIDTVVVNLPPGWSLVETASTVDDTETPPLISTGYTVVNADGQDVGTMALQGNDITIFCFARGTLIETPDGPVAIEDLVVGDMVVTLDNGIQPIRWIGARKLGSGALMLHANLRPIRIRAGALGDGLPVQDLVVSPQHRVLVRSRIAQRMFGTSEVLVAAKQLLDLPGVEIASDLAEVEYFHMLFERHEVVIANGAKTESFYPGGEALKSVGPAAADEILALFPELAEMDHVPAPARVLASGRQGRRLAGRHAQNARALVS
ncbi:Hint domain-containing protein [Paracoccus sp. KR1-242]|uniref:Hint domain-containing protein n=1 Tax=Paracoccus sp. KR1-242 TaxID=3410028 RepID=UPI003C0F99CC